MAGYARQMMAVARRWIETNPDQGDPVLRLPRDPRRSSSRSEDAISRAGRVIREHADDRLLRDRLSGLVERLRGVVAQREDTLRELRAAEDDLERSLNEDLAPSHTQREATLNVDLHVDLGRWFLAWGRHGYNVLDLSSDFVAAMLLTNPRAVDLADVRLPFPGVLVTIPDGFAVSSQGSSYTKIHLTEFAGAVPSAPPAASADQEVPEVPDPPPGSPGPGEYLHVYAIAGSTCLDTLVHRRGLTWDAIDRLPDSVTDDADRVARHTICQVVLCSLAYVSAVRAALEPRDPVGRRPSRRLAEESSPRIWDVGRAIKLGPGLVRAARGGAREIAFRIQYRHVVRGHYRDQPVGPGRVNRRRIWIAPFWRGPEDGAAVVHTYKPVT